MKVWTKRIVGGLLVFSMLCCLAYLFTMQYNWLSPQTTVLFLLLGLIVITTIFVIYLVWQNRKSYTQIHEERNFYDQVLDYIPLPLIITSTDRTLKFMNKAALSLYDCEPNMLGKSCNCLNTSICNTPQCAIERMEQAGANCTYCNINQNNYMVSTAALSDDTNQDRKYIVITQDVTDFIKIQKALEEKTVELETMSENLLAGVLITTLDEGFSVIRCNQYYLNMSGYPVEQVLGYPALQGILPEDADQLTKIFHEQLAKGTEVFIEQRIRLQEGRTIWISLYGKLTFLREQQVVVWILTNISSRKETESVMRVNEERYRIAMENTEDIIIDYDMKTHTMYHSSKATEIYGVPEIMENMPQGVLDSGIVLEEAAEGYLDLFRQLAQGVPKCSCVLRAKSADGRLLWNRLTFTAIFDDDGIVIRAIGVLQDITHEKEVEIQYKRESRYRELIGRDGVLYYEADITHRRFVSGHEDIVKANCKQPTDDFDIVMELLLTYMVYEPDRAMVRSYTSLETINRNYQAGIMCTVFEYRRNHADNPEWMECSMQFFLDEETGSLHYIACLKDINETKKNENSLRHKAERDLLTGLYNKVTTELLIKKITDSSLNSPTDGAFLLIDLDNFKSVNDTLGHAFGDAVLSEVAGGLLSLFRKDDIVGRIGGDEFVAFVNMVRDKATIKKKTQQICNMFHKMYAGSNNNFKISGTVGVALFPAHGKNFKELYMNADRALYDAKRKGKDTFSIYTQELQNEVYVAPAPRKIDANSGKLFGENILEYVLRILHESPDSTYAMSALLELIAKHFRFCRGYIFEQFGDEWKSKFEWCAENLEPLGSELRAYPWDVLQDNGNQFNDGVFMVTGSREHTDAEHTFLQQEGIRSLVWFSVVHNGILQAVLGFDSTDEEPLSQDELDVLRQTSMLIGIFLINSRSKEDPNNPAIAAEQIMDSIEDVIYVVNPTDFSLCYFNRKTRSIVPDASLGAKCYATLCGLNEPCVDCPLCLFLQGSGNMQRRKSFSTVQNAWVDSTVSKILWQDGKEYCLINCVDPLEVTQ